RLGQADVICDLVSSGGTLAANQLRPVETIMRSEAVLAGPVQPFADIRGELAQMLLRRLDGVLRLKDSRLLMFQAQRDEAPAQMVRCRWDDVLRFKVRRMLILQAQRDEVPAFL